MKKFIPVLAVAIMLTLIASCTPPYIDARLSTAKTALMMNNSINEINSAASRGESIQKAGGQELKKALNNQSMANKVASYALKQYRRSMGLFGWHNVEKAFDELDQESEVIDGIIKTMFKPRTGVTSENVEAMTEMFNELSATEKKNFLKKVKMP